MRAVRRMREAQVAAAVVLGGALFANPLQAAPGLQGAVDESYGGVFRQSGTGPFVGVIQGPPAAAPDLRALRAIVPAKRDKRDERPVCFAANTFDGTYSAAATFKIAADTSGPLAIEDPKFSRHNASIGRYAGDQLAVIFVLSRDCELLPEKVPRLLPASFGVQMDVVRVALNTKPTKELQLTLTLPSGALHTAVCRGLGLPASAFLQVCDFHIDPKASPSGFAKLSATRRIGTAPARTESVDLYILGAD